MFLSTAPTGVLTAGPPLKQISGKGVANLWKNEGVAPLRELLYCLYILYVYIIYHQELARCVANGAQAAVGDDACH